MPTRPSPSSERLGTPNPPAIRFSRGEYFGASRFTHLLRPAKLLAPLYGSDRYGRPPRAFTSRLPTARSPFPLLDITTTATGLLCWRVFHPRESQLASLHQNPPRSGPCGRPRRTPPRPDRRTDVQRPEWSAAAPAPQAAMPPRCREA